MGEDNPSAVLFLQGCTDTFDKDTAIIDVESANVFLLLFCQVRA